MASNGGSARHKACLHALTGTSQKKCVTHIRCHLNRVAWFAGELLNVTGLRRFRSASGMPLLTSLPGQSWLSRPTDGGRHCRQVQQRVRTPRVVIHCGEQRAHELVAVG